MSPVYAFFDASLRRGRLQMRIACAVMLVLCAVGGLWAMLEGYEGDRQMSRMLGLSMIGVPVALLMFGLSFRRNGGLEALKDPSQIVWVYGVRQGSLITKIAVGTAAGKLHMISLGDPRRGEEGMQLVLDAAPQATVGLSEPHRQTFKQNPLALRRATPG